MKRIITPTLPALALTAAGEEDPGLSLAGEWRVKIDEADAGIDAKWHAVTLETKDQVTLPSTHAIDGDPNTIWHTPWGAVEPEHPHWLSLDFGKARTLTAVRLTPRQDGPNGRPKTIVLYAGEDGQNWGEPVRQQQAKPGGRVTVIQLGKPLTTRFLKIELPDSADGGKFSSLADLEVVFAAPTARENGSRPWTLGPKHRVMSQNILPKTEIGLPGFRKPHQSSLPIEFRRTMLALNRKEYAQK